MFKWGKSEQAKGGHLSIRKKGRTHEDHSQLNSTAFLEYFKTTTAGHKVYKEKKKSYNKQ